ncbi:MAG TPA: universal stress protein [Gemmatimonadales bacterium]|nr:universal stress protein [Gemmatimonadales bacterium]
MVEDIVQLRELNLRLSLKISSCGAAQLRIEPSRGAAMSWGPIVVGVDTSPAAAGAAAVGERIGRLASVPCRLIHAVRDAWAPLVAVSPDPQVAEKQQLQLVVARHHMNEALGTAVSGQLREKLDVVFGPAAVVLQQAMREQRPGLVILGGKHHSALERWLGGSTSLHVVRSAEVPVLITAGAPTAFRRVLVAADLSAAAGPTIGLAERFARLVGAQLRVLTVFEPLPDLPGVPPMDPVEYFALAQETLTRDVWPLVRTSGVEKYVRHGSVIDTLLREATEWAADVLVVGSHGKGWAQRVLLGSVTERLVNHLPTSLLVAPVGVAAAALKRRERRQPALAAC